MNLKNKIDGLNNKSWNLGLTRKKESYNIALKANKLSLKCNYSKGLANSYLNLAWYYLGRSKYITSNGLFIKSKELFMKIGDIVSVTKSITGISATYYYMGNYAHCIDANIENVILAEKSKDNDRFISALTNSSAVFIKLLNGEKAIEFAQKALEISDELKLNGEQKTVIYKNIGDSYLLMNNFDKSMYYLNKSYKTAIKTGFEECVYESLCSMGKVYHKKGDHSKAEKCFNKIYNLCRNRLNSEEIIFEIGKFYFHIGDLEKSKKYVKESIEMAIKNSIGHILITAYEFYIKICQSTGEYLDDYFYKIKDNLNIFEEYKEKEIEYLREKYEINYISK